MHNIRRSKLIPILLAGSLISIGCEEKNEGKEGKSRKEHNIQLVQEKVDGSRLNAPVKLTAAELTGHNNTYSWHMTLQNDSIIKVEAFLDTYVLHDLLQKITDSTGKRQ